MKLDILKELLYISPSSFMAWENCNYFHYLRKLSGIKFPPWTQTKNAAFGTVFDVVVKSAVSTKKNWPYDRKKAWGGLAITTGMAQLIPDAIAAAKIYNQTGLGLKVTSVDPVIEPMLHNDIPIFGYLDAIRSGIPFDWKTTGYSTNYQASPKPGYRICHNLSNGTIWKHEHKKYGMYLEEIDIGWATQALFYSWMIGNETPGMIVHQLVIGPKRMLLAEYAAKVGPEFIQQTEEKLAQMWEMSGSGEMEDPIPEPSKCKRFNQWCEAAIYCDFWGVWRDDYLAQEKK